MKNLFEQFTSLCAPFAKSSCSTPEGAHFSPIPCKAMHLYIILLVCVLYVKLSMRISVHNKSPELFAVKLESHSRQRVRHWTLEQKVRDRYARRQFNSPCLHGFLFFFLSFFHLQFSYPIFSPFYPLIPFPSPLLKIFFPPQT